MNKFTIGKALLGLIIIMLLQACGSKEKYTFEYKLKEGDTFKQNSVIDMQMTQSIMGQDMKIKTELTSHTNFLVTKSGENNYGLEMKYEKTKMDMDMGTVQVSLDSDTEEDVATLENMGPIFKAMTGKPIQISMDKYGNVETVTGFNQIITDMLASIDSNVDENAKEQFMAMIEQQYSEEAIKDLFKMSFVYSNGKEVAVGESWNITKDAKNNGVSMNIDSKMTLKNVKDNIASIQLSGDLGTPEGGITQSMQGLETKITMQGTQEGEMQVDTTTGLIINMNMTQNMNGEVEAMGMKLPQTIVTKITMTDK